MMLRGLWKLTWIEIKVFLREPLGAFGTIGCSCPDFRCPGACSKPQIRHRPHLPPSGLSGADLPVLVALLISVSAVLSLVTIISIYREGGILKRLRATPLRPQTILSAHVIVKLMLTAATLALMFLAGKRYFPPGAHVPWFSFTIALAHQHVEHSVDRLSHRQHRSHGALCAADRRHHSLPDDRFLWTLRAHFRSAAGAARCGACTAADLRRAPARGHLERRRVVRPTWSDVAALTVLFLLFTAISAKVFRWE